MKNENDTLRHTILELKQIIEKQRKEVNESRRKCKTVKIQHEIDKVKTQHDQN